jgi:hypothetical protein
MNDAYERRALLLHLGSMLQTLSRLLEWESSDENVGELIAKQPMLADVPLLEYAPEHWSMRDFTAAALHAFCLWPQQLLDEPLDRIALAISVRDHLFASNPDGWAAYAATLRAQVSWFGEGLPPTSIALRDRPREGARRAVPPLQASGARS